MVRSPLSCSRNHRAPPLCVRLPSLLLLLLSPRLVVRLLRSSEEPRERGAQCTEARSKALTAAPTLTSSSRDCDPDLLSDRTHTDPLAGLRSDPQLCISMARVAAPGGGPAATPPPLPARPYTAPSSRGRPRTSLSGLGDGFASPSGSAAFIHRDIFAPPRSSLPPKQPVLGDSGSSGSSAGAGYRTPQRSRSREEAESIIPSASKLAAWDSKLGKYPLLGWLESHTGIRKLYSASFLLFAFCALVFKGIGMGLLSILVGFLYPLHMSLKTIENCTGLFEEITGENRGRHTERELQEKREEIIGQLRKWSSQTAGRATQQ